MRYSKTNLTKIETILKSQGYSIRYEKGNFNSGYCLLNDKKVVVINKFYDLKQRIDSFMQLTELLIDFDAQLLSEDELLIWNHLKTKSEQLKMVA